MARFSGKLGFGVSEETKPGVWRDVIVERNYFGDVLANSRDLQETADKQNLDVEIGNRFSIVADAYAYENYLAIRYIYWMGSRLVVSNITVERPRLVLRAGGIYNGSTPGATPAPAGPGA